MSEDREEVTAEAVASFLVFDADPTPVQDDRKLRIALLARAARVALDDLLEEVDSRTMTMGKIGNLEHARNALRDEG